MAGMFALLTASEMARARPSTPPTPTLIPQIENPPGGPDCSSAGALEMVALEGMALLSQMAQQDMEHISLDQGKWRRTNLFVQINFNSKISSSHVLISSAS